MIITEKKIFRSMINMYMEYLEIYVESVLHNYFSKQSSFEITLMDLPLPPSTDPLTQFIKQNKLTLEETIVLLIGLSPHLKPGLFDSLIQQHIPDNGNFPSLGGIRGKDSRIFLPTGETALFLLAGNDLDKRIRYQQLFSNEHFFAKFNLLWLDATPTGEPKTTGRIIFNPEYVHLFITGKKGHPSLSMDFPAQLVSTEMEWDDLVLNESTQLQIHELENWVLYNDTMMNQWDMKKKFKPGYRALFYGPPGTGKTLTASLLGKYTGKDVFRIDLSMIVSKYIGETEKNLSQLFARAENKEWILFFDEADALFSKRTAVKDAHDKYANQEASYLLQRIENFNGLVILATNFRNNIDEAFLRRFHSVIHFPPPNAAERLLIWKKGLPPQVQLSDDVDLNAIAKKYELSGSEIMNVIYSSCLQALSLKSDKLTSETILNGIRKEYLKEGKIW
jgi:DNA polymerase III delta prime subunit